MSQQAHSLFISDLHLCDSRPHITQAFIAFLQETAIKAQALYILGDLFEYWPGDDAMDIGLHQSSIEALKNLSAKGTNTFLMHGNRDFLLGDDFQKVANITLLPDPTLLHLYGKPVLLSHGDEFCTDDVDYQQFRQLVRSNDWQKQFSSQPLKNRIAYIEDLRIQSTQEKSHKSMTIMDVNTDAVAALLREHHYPPLFIHGHTHRPQRHLLDVDGHSCERWVLGDWYEQGSYLMLDADGCRSQSL